MTYEERKEKVIEWLKDNDVFEKFMYNLLYERPGYNPFTEKELNVYLISKSFSWIHTQEGLDFWRNIDKKYYEFYGNLTTNKTTKMKEKSIKIEVPEGYEIDKEKSTFENIIFKKKETKPWRKKYNNVNGYYIGEFSVIKPISDIRWMPTEFNVFATKKQAESALAMAQISQIMVNDPRFGGNISDEEWQATCVPKWTIYRRESRYCTEIYYGTYVFLAFHTKEQRDLFLKENEDLVKQYLMID